MTPTKKHDDHKAAQTKDADRALHVAEVRIRILYRAIIEMKGGADPNLERAFADAEEI